MKTQTQFSVIEIQAAQEYLDRRDRKTHPAGRFDKGGRFYISESCSCGSVRSPSRSYPYSEMVHGRTIKHVANIYNCDELNVRCAAKMLDQPRHVASDDIVLAVVSAGSF